MCLRQRTFQRCGIGSSAALELSSFGSGIQDIGLRWADWIRRVTDLFNKLAASRVRTGPVV